MGQSLLGHLTSGQPVRILQAACCLWTEHGTLFELSATGLAERGVAHDQFAPPALEEPCWIQGGRSLLHSEELRILAVSLGREHPRRPPCSQ